MDTPTTTPFVPPAGATLQQNYDAIFPGMLARALASAQAGVDATNAYNASQFANACATWLQDAGFDRDNKLPIKDKPIAEPTRTLVTQAVPAGVWYWFVDGARAVCPDLPAPPPPHDNVIVNPASLPGVATVDLIRGDTQAILQVLGIFAAEMAAIKLKLAA